jgi:hypothetical protein
MSLSDARHADEALSRLPPRVAAKPGPDARVIRRRMATVITEHLTMSGSITAGDLERAGFEADDVAAHFRPALKLARANRMAA